MNLWISVLSVLQLICIILITFLYFRLAFSFTDKKNCKWQHVYKHFARSCNDKCRFDEITVDLCNKFREHLLNAPQTIHTEHKLHINSVAGYWSTFRAVLHTAYREHKIMENPNGFLERINTIPTEKEHLSKDELIRLANTPCSSEVYRTASSEHLGYWNWR